MKCCKCGKITGFIYLSRKDGRELCEDCRREAERKGEYDT